MVTLSDTGCQAVCSQYSQYCWGSDTAWSEPDSSKCYRDQYHWCSLHHHLWSVTSQDDMELEKDKELETPYK